MTDKQQRRTVVHDPAERESSPAVWTEQVREVYGHIRGPLWRALVAWSGSTDAADEAVAEGFAQLLRRGPEVRDPTAWVWRLSRSQVPGFGPAAAAAAAVAGAGCEAVSGLRVGRMMTTN